MENLTIYTHILFASIWIGGMIIFLSFIVYVRKNKKFKQDFLNTLGNFYGWLNVAVLVMLVLTGICLVAKNNLFSPLFETPFSEISKVLWLKILFVVITVTCTIIHSFIVVKIPVNSRTKLINIINRGCSLLMFVSCFLLLYYGILLRNLI